MITVPNIAIVSRRIFRDISFIFGVVRYVKISTSSPLATKSHAIELLYTFRIANLGFRVRGAAGEMPDASGAELVFLTVSSRC
jgi:hypothetical protein